MQKETPAKAQKVKLALRAAFPMTIPVMVGYLFLGAAFGILLESKGYGFGWAALMSVIVYAGSMQFVAVDLLATGAGFLQVALMTLMVCEMARRTTGLVISSMSFRESLAFFSAPRRFP